MVTRTQSVKPKFGKKRRLITIIVAVAVSACAVVAVCLMVSSKYSPPSMDKHAKSGSPTVDEGFLYAPVQTKFDYTFSMAANLYQQEDHSVKIYLTNPEDSNVNLQCVISDQDSGKTLYKSGVIAPGKYLESMKPVGSIKNEMKEVEVNVYAYEIDTWYSKGTTTMELVLQPW